MLYSSLLKCKRNFQFQDTIIEQYGTQPSCMLTSKSLGWWIAVHVGHEIAGVTVIVWWPLRHGLGVVWHLGKIMTEVDDNGANI